MQSGAGPAIAGSEGSGFSSRKASAEGGIRTLDVPEARYLRLRRKAWPMAKPDLSVSCADSFPGGEAFVIHSTPRKYNPLVQAPGSKEVGTKYSSRIRSTSRAFSVVKFSRMAHRPSFAKSFWRSSQ